MFDIFVLYNAPKHPSQFETHYRSVHAGLVLKMPGLKDFSWGLTAPESSVHLVARMSFADQSAADAGLESPEGVAAVDDLANFAQAGVTILRAPRQSLSPAQAAEGSK